MTKQQFYEIKDERDLLRQENATLKAQLEQAVARFKQAQDALEGRLGVRDDDVLLACLEYVATEDELPDTFDSEDYRLSKAVGSLVHSLNDANTQLEQTEACCAAKDDVLKQCRAWVGNCNCRPSESANELRLEINKVSTDCGQGWHSPEEWTKLEACCAGMRSCVSEVVAIIESTADKCKNCNGSGRDHDGEGWLDTSCPDCLWAYNALAALDPMQSTTCGQHHIHTSELNPTIELLERIDFSFDVRREIERLKALQEKGS